MWDKIVEHKDLLRSIRRIESPITPGASDVVYVGHKYHGWIELKTTQKPRPRRPFSLHSPYTLTQNEWLLAHNDPKQSLRSWLLLGIIGPRTWRGFVLVDPKNSVALLQGRKGIPHEELINRPGVRQYETIKEFMLGLDV